MRRAFWLWVLFVGLWASPAGATTGGPDELVFLGYDAPGEKLYFAKYLGGETDDVELHYLFVRGPQRGKIVVAKSWAGSTRGDAAFEARLAALKARLVSLASDTSVSLTQKRVKRVQHQGYPGDPPRPGWSTEVTVKSGKRRASKRVVIFDTSVGQTVQSQTGKARLVSAWRVPGRGTVAVVEYVGIPHEFGYETQQAIWIAN